MSKKTAAQPAQNEAKSPPLTTAALAGLLGDFRLLVILFVGFRLLLLIVYQPFLIQNVERGITTGGDFQTYYQIASLSKSVGMPLRDWWSEFPPLWSHFAVLLYQLQGASYGSFAFLMGIIFLAVDTGNLILIRKLGSRLYKPETGMALAWVYTVLLAPLVFTFWTFEGLVVFSLLLGTWWLVEKRDTRSALAIAVGTLIKFTPALALGALWRMVEVRRAVRYSLVVGVLVVGVYLPFLAQNAAMTMPSLTAQFNKASYETIWALIDGNFRTGNFGPLEERLDPANAAIMQGNPPRIPGWLRLGAAGFVGVLVFARTRRFDDKGLVAFLGITMLIFFIQAQGWSPQWVMQIVPFVLLCFPTRNGVLALLMLSFATFAEYPFLFIRTGDTGGEISGALVAPYAIVIIARTGILVGLCVAFYNVLRQARSKTGVALNSIAL